MNKQKIIFVVGPTAIGKSQVAVHLARKLNARIISCDSMQIYRKMDIVTSMPRLSLRKKVKHYLLNVIPSSEEYDVFRYRADALLAMREIAKRKKIPLFVGGTGLYMSILIDGLFPEAGKDKGLRAALAAREKKKGSGYLHGQLTKIDPLAGQKIHPHDAKRIIRALEVFHVTGKKISQLQTTRKGLGDEYDVEVFGLSMDRESLYRRIDRRVDSMFRQGVASEVKKALATGLSKTASCAIGIREIKGYLEGLYDLKEAKRLMKVNSRRYAKRQLTWFRKDKRIQWITIKEKEAPRNVAQRLWKKLS